MDGHAAHSCGQRGILDLAGLLATCAAIFTATLPATCSYTPQAGIQGVSDGKYTWVSLLSPAASKTFPSEALLACMIAAMCLWLFLCACIDRQEWKHSDLQRSLCVRLRLSEWPSLVVPGDHSEVYARLYQGDPGHNRV